MTLPLTIYTDGSSIAPGGPGGWAFVVTKEYRITSETVIRCGGAEHSNANQMELMAVLEALRWTVENNYTSVEIRSDSQYAVTAIGKIWVCAANSWPDDTKDLFILKEIYELLKSVKLNIILIPGHSGNPFNHAADEHAKAAASRFSAGGEIFRDIEAGDAVAARINHSSFTRSFKIIGKFPGSGTVMMKAVYARAKKTQPFVLSASEFNRKRFVKIKW